jgi:hypothetical protein
MTIMKLGNQLLSVSRQNRTDSRTSSSFKSRSIWGTLVHRCHVGPFCRQKRVCAPKVSEELSPQKMHLSVIHDDSGAINVAGLSPTPPAAFCNSDLPRSFASETRTQFIDSNCPSKAESSAIAPRVFLKRNHVILSDSSGDDDGSAAAANVKARRHSGVQGGGSGDSIDLVTFSEEESSDQILSDDIDFINDESSSFCSSSSNCPPFEAERNPIILRKNNNPMPPCQRCMKKDGERFRCSECSRIYHEVCGGPGPSCTLCSECASALGVDPTQLSSDADNYGDADPSVISSSSDDKSSTSESSNAEYECAVCHENDCGYIRACRVCGTRAHEYCGGPGPLHRKCDRFASFLIPVLKSFSSFDLTPLPTQLYEAKQSEAPKARLKQGGRARS